MTKQLESAKTAVTYYKVIETAGRRAAWLALVPLTVLADSQPQQQAGEPPGESPGEAQ